MEEEIENQQFDFNDAVQQLLSGKNINGKDGVLAPLVKQLVEAALEAISSSSSKFFFHNKLYHSLFQ